MNILQLTNKVPYPPKDGGAIAILNLSSGFVELGHKVTILAMNTSKHYFDLKKLPEDVKTRIDIIGVNIDTRISFFAALTNLLFSGLPYNARRFISKDYENKLIELLQENRFDVIQLEGLYLGPYITVIKKYSNALAAMRSHNIEHEIWHRFALQQENILKRQYFHILSKRIKKLKLRFLNNYDVLVPITERDGNVYNKLGNKMPVHITPTGINSEELSPDRSNLEYPSLFHIGALDWVPNQQGLIWFLKKAWNTINKKYPDLKFYIAGRNAPEWFIQKIRYNNVTYVGEVENAYKFMNTKAVMIVPLLSGSGMRIKIIEGMALGKTIVSTSIGAEGINCTHEKDILIADTVNDFINEIERVIINNDNFETIGENAIIFAKENFDNVTISESLIDFYKSHKRLEFREVEL